MRKRWGPWIGVLGVALAASAVLAWCWCQRGPWIDMRAWRSIDLGISLAEAEALIGAPPGRCDGGEPAEYIAFVWQTDERPVPPRVAGPSADVRSAFRSFRSSDPPPRPFAEVQARLRPGDRIVTWTGPRFAIAVQVDRDDRVVATCLGALAEEDMRPGWRESVLDWLGLP